MQCITCPAGTQLSGCWAAYGPALPPCRRGADSHCLPAPEGARGTAGSGFGLKAALFVPGPEARRGLAKFYFASGLGPGRAGPAPPLQPRRHMAPASHLWAPAGRGFPLAPLTPLPLRLKKTNPPGPRSWNPAAGGAALAPGSSGSNSLLELPDSPALFRPVWRQTPEASLACKLPVLRRRLRSPLVTLGGGHFSPGRLLCSRGSEGSTAPDPPPRENGLRRSRFTRAQGRKRSRAQIPLTPLVAHRLCSRCAPGASRWCERGGAREKAPHPRGWGNAPHR